MLYMMYIFNVILVLCHIIFKYTVEMVMYHFVNILQSYYCYQIDITFFRLLYIFWCKQ
jgi:hypothetical protein